MGLVKQVDLGEIMEGTGALVCIVVAILSVPISPAVTTKTKGVEPTAPDARRFLEVSAGSVTLHLNEWQDGGDPILFFDVEYKPKNQKDWIVANNNFKPRDEFVVLDLNPATWYNLKVTAHNNAGSSIAEYKFATLTANGGVVADYVETELEDVEMKVSAVEDKVQVLQQKIDTISKSLDRVLTIINQNFGTDLQIGNKVSNLPTDGVKGILVAGGTYISSGKEKLTHVFIPCSNKTCDFPELPEQRYSHSLDTVGNTPVLCGGGYYKGGTYFDGDFSVDDICLHLTPPTSSGTWSVSSVTTGFSTHSSWNSKDGLILMGGRSNLRTEIVQDLDPNSKPKWPLKNVNYGFDLVNKINKACAISMEDSVIITGGEKGYNSFITTVIEYNLKGFVKYLPDMNEDRAGHGCGSYKSNGALILLVAGGGGGAGNFGLYDNYRSSTEKMTLGDQAWTFAKPLPWKLYAPGSVSMDNKVYILAGMSYGGNFQSEVLTFDGQGWTEVGHVKYQMRSAGATVITMEKEEVEKHCK